MHIREGDASNIIISDKSYVILEFQTEKKKYKIEEEVLFASLGKNKFEPQYQIGQNIIGVRLKEFIPNPVASIVESRIVATLVNNALGSLLHPPQVAAQP